MTVDLYFTIGGIIGFIAAILTVIIIDDDFVTSIGFAILGSFLVAITWPIIVILTPAKLAADYYRNKE